MLTVAALTPSLDLTFVLTHLRLGEIHRTSEVVRCAGGKALNMARAAAAVGADVQVVAILGGRTGESLSAMLQTEGLSVTPVSSPRETRTCVSIAAEDAEQLTEVYQEAAPLPDGVWPRFRSSVDTLLTGSTGWLSVSGRAPEGSADRIAELVAVGRRRGLRIAVDTHGEALPRALTERPNLVKVNRSEAAEVLGVDRATDLGAMAVAIHSTTGGVVVLTDGPAGALATDGQDLVHASTAEFGRFPVGSGDAFLGGLLTALDRGDDLEAGLRLATACGAANALVPGPGRLELGDVERVAAQILVRRPG